MILHDDQRQLVARIGQSLRAGHRRVCVQAPTGSGKTVLMAHLAHLLIDKGARVLVLVPRRELAFQMVATLERFGKYAGLIMSGEERLEAMDMYVASMDTLHARCMQRDIMPLPKAEWVFADEVHLALARTRKDIIDAYPNARIIGWTATPSRSDGKGLGRMFDDLIIGPSIRELTDLGRLVPLRYYAGSMPNLEDVKIVGGDYHQGQLEDRVDKPRLIGDIIDNWMRLASDRQTVIFCTSIKHSRHVASELVRRGVTAEHLDGNTPAGERAEILERVSDGRTQVLTNVYVASYGLDIPSLSCAVMARPTKSLVLYFQTVGRVLRTCKGKTDALLLDHAGCVSEHGFIDDPVPWTLDGNAKADQDKERRERKEPKDIQCPDCGTIWRASPVCPECGHKLAGGMQAVPYYDIDLEEVARDKKRANREATPEEKALFFAELKGWVAAHGKAPGYAHHLYRRRYGVWPNRFSHVDPAAPTQATANYVKHLQIRAAKSRA